MEAGLLARYSVFGCPEYLALWREALTRGTNRSVFMVCDYAGDCLHKITAPSPSEEELRWLSNGVRAAEHARSCRLTYLRWGKVFDAVGIAGIGMVTWGIERGNPMVPSLAYGMFMVWLLLATIFHQSIKWSVIDVEERRFTKWDQLRERFARALSGLKTSE